MSSSDPCGGLLGSSGGASGGRDDVKTQFVTREGLYKLMSLSEYTRPNRIGYSANPGPMGGGGGGGGTGGGANAVQNRMASVRVSFSKESSPPTSSSSHHVKMGNGSSSSAASESSTSSSSLGTKIVFNYGREIFVYPYRGIRKAADLTKPVDKRIYKGTCPTCHDFGAVSNLGAKFAANGHADDVAPLLVGFTQGQIQLVDPVRKDLSKLYNEERLIDKSCVTCIKWIPGSSNHFLVSFSSGNMYVFNHELPCSPTAPVYQVFKQGPPEGGFSIYTCKAKSTRNPLYKWAIGHGAINQFAFSPCGHFLATASQDGYMRLFNYDSMELAGVARSYFGGFTCVCWSPDGKYIACGGEDDLVTVFSVAENRVVVRGQGHKSWVSQVCFDEYNMSYGDVPDGLDFSGSDEEGSSSGGGGMMNGVRMASRVPPVAPPSSAMSADDQQRVACYRLGSVGEDAHLCLWDLTDDLLKKASLSSMAATTLLPKSRCSSPDRQLNHTSPSSLLASTSSGGNSSKLLLGNSFSSKDSGCSVDNGNGSNHTSTASSLTQRFASLNFGDKHRAEHKRNFSLSGTSSGGSKASGGGGSSDKASSTSLTSSGLGSSGAAPVVAPGGARVPEYVKLGSLQCPRIAQVPLVEPLVSKRISQERLTCLVFLEECFVTACQDGYICTWARPGKGGGNYSVNMMCPGSPPQNMSGGTIV